MGIRWTEEQLASATRAIADRVVAAPTPVRVSPPTCAYDHILMLLRAHHVPEPVREHRFHPRRRWRLDLAWPDRRVGVEIEGGLWSKSERARAAHGRPLAILRDMEKHNAAIQLGWAVLRYTPEQIVELPAIEQILDVWWGRA